MYLGLRFFTTIILLELTQAWNQRNSQDAIGMRSYCGSLENFISYGSSTRFKKMPSEIHCEEMNETFVLIETLDKKYVLDSNVPTHGIESQVTFGVVWGSEIKVENQNELSKPYEQRCIKAQSVYYKDGCIWNVIQCQEILNVLSQQNGTQDTQNTAFAVDIASFMIGFFVCFVISAIVLTLFIVRLNRSTNARQTREQVLEKRTSNLRDCQQPDDALQENSSHDNENLYLNFEPVGTDIPNFKRLQSTTPTYQGSMQEYEMQRRGIEGMTQQCSNASRAGNAGDQENTYVNFAGHGVQIRNREFSEVGSSEIHNVEEAYEL